MSQPAIDESALLSSEQIRLLLGWVRENAAVEGAVYPFLVSIAEAALSPGEAVALRVDDMTLPEGEFGEASIRAGEGRKVPVAPELVILLRGWISRADLEPGDLLFPSERGVPLSSSVRRRVWKQAREAVLRPDELEAGLGEHVTSLRDSCLEKWLNAGVPVWGVAEWAGVTPSWLALRYPHCFRAEDTEVDWDHLAQVMALPDSLKS
ncbi:tyrosine-type recombinase/integrase [Streptomyces nigrescens]|uniref:Site-specific integrase n=1 Tax=Streptomyces nigrescens TaxID=1920 RepID=A0ABY7J1D6_STRNI|nr:tyrosine-type recombinase/integrase [Streptomyces nigrescens]WAU03982.1 site-specific integrase [Streptomyces nigrescens]